MDILQILFIKNISYDKKIFSTNLYYSNPKITFVRFNKEKFELIKTYSHLEIINDINNKIGDSHIERKSIIKCDNDSYFVRILYDDLNLIYDILIYKISNLEYEKYLKIFFPKKINLDNYLQNLNKFIILYEDNHFKIIKYNDSFLKNFGYQSWDYENKSSGYFDVSIENKNEVFKLADLKKSFISSINLICNNNEIKCLNVEFEYYKDNFYILSIKE